MLLNGKEYRPASPTQAVEAGVSMLPEDRQTQGAYLEKSISDNIYAAVLKKISGRMGILQRGKQEKIAQDALTRLNVKASGIHANVGELSGGNQQKVVLGKWIETQPQVLILDSPTVGVDIGSKSEIYEYIQLLAKQGLALILISDEIPELLANCNRLLVLREGKIAGELSSSDLESKEASETIRGYMSEGKNA